VIEKGPQGTQTYKGKNDQMTLDGSKAVLTKEGHPEPLKASKLNHGNITPSLWHEDDKKKRVLNHGGVTFDYAEQHTVLSLAALRRLRFPVISGSSAQADLAGRTVVAALGLAAICFLDEDGYDLRSRCLLDGKPGTLEFVGRGETQPFELDADGAAALLKAAASEAVAAGLPWPEKPLTLAPSADLAKLVVESRKRSMAEVADAGK